MMEPLTIQDLVHEILKRLELDGHPGVDGTPSRVARVYLELTSGYLQDENPQLTTFDETVDQMVCQWNIPFASLCEHHLLPFMGYVHVGYIPKGRVLGLSKFKRIVDMYAKRLQIQERLTREVADCIERVTEPRGVMIVVEAEHTCMAIRGVTTPGTLTTTSAVTGDFLLKGEGSREEFLSLLAHNRRRES